MIWVSGSVARDLIMDFPDRFAAHIEPDKLHILNLSFAVTSLKENLGGTAANIAYNLARLSEKVEIVASIGSDQQGLTRYFRKLNIGQTYLRVSQKFRTACAYIITDRDDNQITGFYAGAMYDPGGLPKNARAGDWAIISAEEPKHMVRLAKDYARKKVKYIFDPGQQITALSKEDLAAGLKGAQVLIGNDYELALVTKRTSLRAPIVVRTLGPKGSEIYFLAGQKISVGIARPKAVLDPTGAGDAYRAGFLKGLVLGYNLKTCGELGATVASFAVECHGTQNHRFTWTQIVKRHNRDFKEKI